MTPGEAKQMYRAQVHTHGETVTLRRVNTAPAPATEVTLPANVRGYRPEELVGGIGLGHREVLILAEDVDRVGFPAPIRRNDRIVVGGTALTVTDVDVHTRRVAGVLIAYDIVATGA
jgi:hypothetical protein